MKRNRLLLLLVIVCLACLATLVLSACKPTPIEPVEYTITFMVDGSVYKTVTTAGNTTIAMPANPTKNGYTFDGWYWDDGTWQRPFTANSLLNEPLTSNMSVYAKFVSDRQSEYNNAYQDIAKAIKTYAQTKNTLSDGVSYIFTGNADNASDFSFQFALLYNEPYNGDAYIGVELIIKKDGNYNATLMYTFEQNQNDAVKGVYTDYATKSKGYFTLTPNDYYNNTNVSFNRFVWGSGYSELEYSETPYKLVYESGASVYTQTGISLFDKFLKEEFSYGMEKLGFVNMRKAKTADPISTIYCKSPLTLKVGQTVEVPYVTFPFYNKGNVTLTSSDNSVVTVSGSSITAVSAGSTTVTISAGSVSKSVSVTVNPVTNADIVRKFLNDYSEAYFDANGNKLNSVPSQGLYYKLVTLPDGDGGTTFSIVCKRGDSQPTRLETHDLTLYFNLPNDGNVITQIYNTATALYTYYVDSNHVDVTHLNDFEVASNGKLNFKFTKTSYMESLDPYDALTVLDNMQSVVTETIETLGVILSKNSNGYLDANKTSYFDLSLSDATATTATFDCDFSQYFGERIKSAKLYQNGSLVDDCTDKFSADYTLSNLSSNTSYSLEVIFAYDKNDGNGEQTVVRTVNFTTKIANGTPCTVTYNANGGEVETNTQTLQYNNYYTLYVPTRTGHNFDGWYSNDELVENSGTWTLGLNVTLVARWSVATYSIRYGNVSGATNNNPATYTFGTSVSVSNPTKTGYTFLGWTTSSSAEPIKNYAITSSDTGDLQLTARWQANEYTVTFECNGADEELSPIQIEYDAWFALPDISRVGYTFNGWYNASTKMSNGYYKTAQNITLSARWTANKNTPYSVEVYQQNINDDEYTLFKTTNLTGTSDSSVSPSVEAYTGFTTPARQTVNLSADGSLVVKYYYLRNSYTVNYVTNGGVAMESTSHKYESALNLADAVRDNFTFGGWHTDVCLTNAVAETTMPAKNITVYAWWTEETKAGDFSYSGTNSITVSKYNGTSTSVRIPSFIGDVAVTAIGSSAFQNNTNVTSVTLNDGIVSIGSYAFSGCSALTQFNSDNANEIVVPNKVETIGEYAFQNVSLVTIIVVADSVTSIGVSAFKGCNALEDITLPFVGANETTTDGSDRVFGYIFGHDSANNDSIRNYKTSANDGKTYQGYFATGSYRYYYYHYIPQALRNVTITKQQAIPENAFYNCDLLEKITIPDNVTSIGGYAFNNCHALKQLNSSVDGEFNIPTSVTAISDYAFYGNQQASKVTLGQDVTSIGNYAFSGCSALNNINVTADMTIASTSFSGCLMTTKTGVCYVGEVLYIYNGTMPSGYVLNVKPGTVSIYANALKGQTGLTKVILPESVTAIGNSAFEDCTALAEITQTKSIQTLGQRSFYNCKLLTSIDISDVTVVPQYSFYDCVALKEISLPNVVTIADRAFSGCSALSKFNSDVEGQLILPECCASIGQYAFADCTALTDVDLANATYASSALANCPSLARLTVANVDTYLGVIFGTTSVSGSYAARQNTTTYYIPSTLTEVVITAQSSNKIANYAFANCKSLVRVTLPNNVTDLGEYAFNGCVALQQVVLPTELNTIGQYCFNGCTALTDADLSVCSLQTINAYAFQNCSALNSVYINSSVTFIGEYVFNGCTNLTISCQVAEYPSDWDYNWNPSNCTVNWGVESNIL